MSQGIKLVQEGGFEGLYKATFGPMAEGEQLRKTYASYLSTSTGPVAGTLYISNLKFAFCSDRPLAYAPTPGQTAWSYYKVSKLMYFLFIGIFIALNPVVYVELKRDLVIWPYVLLLIHLSSVEVLSLPLCCLQMVVPLEKVKEVIPSFNETKPAEKYIQVLTNDGHDFWFMGFVNYDKGVRNMQLAPKNIGVIDPNGGLKAPWAGLSVPGMKKTGTSGPQSPSTVPAGHIPTADGPSPNYPPSQAAHKTM